MSIASGVLAARSLRRAYSSGKAIGIDPGTVAVGPFPVDETRKPAGRGGGERFERGPQLLADELHPVQRPHRGRHVRGIGPLPAPGAQQAGAGQPLQDRLQHLLLQAVPDQAVPEVPQDGEAEARVVEFQAEQELPVRSRPHLVGGLPLRQALDA
jgi:hypothetical protein